MGSTREAGADRGEGREAETETLADASGASPAARRGTAHRALFVGTPREVLARLSQGDPLGLRELVARHVRAHCVALDADRLHLRALALCARGASRLRGTESLAGFVMARIDDAAQELLQEDARRAPVVSPALARSASLEPAAASRAAAAFNACSPQDRRAFVELVLERRGLDELARHTGESATGLARGARRALEAALVELERSATGGARGARANGAGTNGTGTRSAGRRAREARR